MENTATHIIFEKMQEADRHFQKGLFYHAEQLYCDILINNPYYHEALLGLALSALSQNKITDAIKHMVEAVKLAPNIELYRRNLGELLRRTSQLTAAIESHKIAISLWPTSPENHFLLGLTYHDNCEFQLAIQHYYIALSLKPNYGEVWNNLGASLENLGDKTTAKIAYTTAISLNENHPEAHNNLGVIYSEEGQLESAKKHFRAAINANPNFIDAHYNLSLIKTYTASDPHLAILQTNTKNMAHLPIAARIRYYFALGKAFDDTKQYARAFQAYAIGNSLHFMQKPWVIDKLKTLVKQIPQVFTHSFFREVQTTHDTRYPIFIVGMPRSGTSLIEQILASHHRIFGAGELKILDEVIQNASHASKMPFNTWVAALTAHDLECLGKNYLDRTWKLAPEKNFIVDKMPGNWFYVGMIFRMFPNAKIIHAMRDPMDSCFSCFTHLFKDDMLFAYDLKALGNYYQFYAETMKHWQAVLPDTAIFNVSYERLVDQHEMVVRDLINFIGLPWDSNCLNFYKNTRMVKTASITQVRKPIYKTSKQRWLNYANELQPLLEIVTSYRNIKGISA